jgi:bla regulator protein BlaR1
MVAERERACDEEVLQMGCEPAAYVEGILKVCRFCMGSPLPCTSGVTGADVKKRLRAILTGSIARELTVGKKVVLAAVALAVLSAPIVIGVLTAPTIQAQNARGVEFEVASIKPSSPGTIGPTIYNSTRERFAIDGISLKGLIAYGYDVRDFQVSGGPGWVDSDQYDIVAKPQGDITSQSILEMTRNLLAERFNLRLHRETKEMTAFSLTVAKGGAKLQRSEGSAGPEIRGGKGRLVARNVTLEMFAAQLAGRALGRPVLDHTDLDGKFDITLDWAPDERPDLGPSLFTAMQEKLGLKLVAEKSTVEVLVIDNVERPSAN